MLLGLLLLTSGLKSNHETVLSVFSNNGTNRPYFKQQSQRDDLTKAVLLDISSPHLGRRLVANLLEEDDYIHNVDCPSPTPQQLHFRK